MVPSRSPTYIIRASCDRAQVAEHTAEENKEKHYTRGVEKLRLEGIPRWPSLDRHTNMPYYIFAEDLKVWLSLMNHKYGEVLNVEATDNEDISPADNAIVLRYICAALSNPTVSTHIAQNYAGDGRKAWKQLHLQFGLPSTSQSALRQSLDRLVLSPHADARLQMMLYDRICARIIPPMSSVEKAETLLKKIPHQDLASTIECMQGDRPEYEGKLGVKALYEKLVVKRKLREIVLRSI